MAELHDVTEQYLLTVLELEEEGIAPIRARLVEWLGLTAPTVSQTVGRLVDEGYLEVRDDRVLELTERGRRIAVSVVRKHRLAERLLSDVIGLEWWKIHGEACRWEHAVSEEVVDRLVDLLGDPGTCPHGNPIPGSANVPDQSAAVPLETAGEGPVVVVRISEELETDEEAMRLLQDCGFIPGRAAEIVGRDDDGIKVVGARSDAVLPHRIGARTYVEAR